MQRRRHTGLPVIVWTFLAWSYVPAHAQEVIKTCGIVSARDACIFEIDALATGIVAVDTRASMPDQHWRAAITVVGGKPIKSSIGSGDTTAFTGLVWWWPVVAGVKYEVMVLYEGPLSSTFPTRVDVRFRGAVSVADAREGPPLPAPDRYVGRTSQTVFFSFQVSADGSYVAEMRMTNHSCLGALVTFAASFEPDVIPIAVGPDGRRRFDARNVPIGLNRTLDIDGVLFDGDGVDDIAEQALGGLSLTINLGVCPGLWVAGAVPFDSDGDHWNDNAELRFGSLSNSVASTPEHREIPMTSLRVVDSCHDGSDNDLDNLPDGQDPDCAP